MTGINTLEYGAPCTVTTHDQRVVTGEFLGIEVAHGDRALLVTGPAGTRSIPFAWVLSAAGTTPRAA
jgi:hypothetical protein